MSFSKSSELINYKQYFRFILQKYLPLKSSYILLMSDMGYRRYRFNDYEEFFDTVLEPFNRYAYVGSAGSVSVFFFVVPVHLLYYPYCLSCN